MLIIYLFFFDGVFPEVGQSSVLIVIRHLPSKLPVWFHFIVSSTWGSSWSRPMPQWGLLEVSPIWSCWVFFKLASRCLFWENFALSPTSVISSTCWSHSGAWSSLRDSRITFATFGSVAWDAHRMMLSCSDSWALLGAKYCSMLWNFSPFRVKMEGWWFWERGVLWEKSSGLVWLWIGDGGRAKRCW